MRIFTFPIHTYKFSLPTYFLTARLMETPREAAKRAISTYCRQKTAERHNSYVSHKFNLFHERMTYIICLCLHRYVLLMQLRLSAFFHLAL